MQFETILFLRTTNKGIKNVKNVYLLPNFSNRDKHIQNIGFLFFLKHIIIVFTQLHVGIV